MAFCKITFVGNVGREPEMRYTASGKAVTQFSVAVSSSKPDGNGGWIDLGTDWFRVTSWGDYGERLAETIKKGQKVLVDGRFKTREWEGKDDGAKHTSLDVTADTVLLIGARVADGDGQFGTTGPQPGAAGPNASANDDLDDLPF